MQLLIVFGLVGLSAITAYCAPNKVAFPMDFVVLPPAENDMQERITNGNPAAEGQFPYQAGLLLRRSDGNYWCGGSLIGSNWVLTAAHCTDGVLTAVVYLGSIKRSSPEVSLDVDASDIFQHTRYNSTLLNNDISLIRIPTVTYTIRIQPIRLPAISSTYSTYGGNYVIASGWGRTAESTSVVEDLNYARLQVISNTLCAAAYGTATVTDNTICVSTPQGTSTCQGDSGGPLVLESSQLLVGVTSFVSSRGCTVGNPSGFVRVTGYLNWIKDRTGIFY